MDALRQWLLGITAAAMALALAAALTPEGPIKKVGKLISGLVLLLVVSKPLVDLAPAEFAAETFALPSMEAPANALDPMKTLIAEKAAAYIADKGTALGCVCTASVTVELDASGWPVPWSVEVSGHWSPQQKEELSRFLAEDFQIPMERQSFKEAAT